MMTIWPDVRYSLRLLARQPGFTLVAILTLALGIGASTAIFSVIDAAILHPLPYPHPEHLVSVWIEQADPSGEPSRYGPSLADMRRWQDAGVFASIVAWRNAFLGRVIDGPEPERGGIGLGGATLATRVIASFLFQTTPTDPVTFTAVAITLIATGCLAAWVPARRAARVNPVTALRMH